MDPLLAINKVFSPVSQEERQRKVGSQFNSSGDSTNTMAFAMKNDSNYRPTQGVPNKSTANNSNSAKSNRNSQKGGRPFCTHCNYLGYTFEKCYKLHGYPPGFRQKQKPLQGNSQNTMVN